MSSFLRMLLIALAGAVILQASLLADDQCIDQGVQISPANDTAIMRARSSLEMPEVRVLMVAALHLVKIGDLPAPPTFTPCMIFKGAHESGAGANLTYIYKWPSGSLIEFEVTFHCDNMGRIDRVEAAPSSNQPFVAFGNYLQETQGKLTGSLINKLTEPDDSKREDAFDRQAREMFGQVVGALSAAAFGIDPRSFTVFALDTLYDAQFTKPPARGMDNFLFGLGETREFRQIAINRTQVSKAVQDISTLSVDKVGLHEEGSYDGEADQIAATAETCAQITAHDAFTVTVGGNRGTENLTALNPAFAVCNGSAMLAHARPGVTRMRPLLFSITPAGRGWRDGKGMFITVWFQPRESDPPFTPAALFDRYGLFMAVLPQPDIACADPPGGGTPPDRNWIQEGATNVVYRFRFDCEHAEIYDAPSHLLLADLALQRSPGNPRKDVYKGVGPISDCPNGTGKVEISRWSPTRIEVKIEEPNSVDHVCGGLKTGHIINGLTHDDTIKIVFLPGK